MPQFFITKSTGERAPFDVERVKATCRRAGASIEFCEHIGREVRARVFDGMTSREIFNLILEMLNKENPGAAARYCLRDAIFRLGPLGFDFEKYIAKLFGAYGYKTELPPILKGVCTSHEVDIMAKKGNRQAMIECKFRHSIDIFVSLKDTMATWARFLDLVDSAAIGQAPHFDECWIVTNARFSTESLQFGHCKNMVMLSWNHPKERPLPAWIDDRGLYPITVIPHLSDGTQKKLIEGGFILVQDLVGAPATKVIEITGLTREKVQELNRVAQEVLKR